MNLNLKRVVKREVCMHDKRGKPIMWIETMECGHTNSTPRTYPDRWLPCLTCDAKAAKKGGPQ